MKTQSANSKYKHPILENIYIRRIVIMLAIIPVTTIAFLYYGFLGGSIAFCEVLKELVEEWN